MAGVVSGGGVAASTIITYIAYIVTIGLHFIQLRICLQFNGAGDVVLEGFVLMDKSVNCFKLFITAYRQVHSEGVGLPAFACLVGFSIHLCAIVIHLHNNHRSRARAWISGMAVFLAAGACMLAIKIPEDCAWHTIAVEATLDVFICLEAVLLVLNKMSEHGGSDSLLLDLIMTSVETLINYWLFADYLVNTHSPWDAQNILHLVGSSLAVLIGLGQIGLLAYKAYTHGVFAWEAETAAGAAADGGDVEQQRVVEEGAEVEEGGRKTCPLFTREVEMAAGAATIEAASDEGEGSS